MAFPGSNRLNSAQIASALMQTAQNMTHHQGKASRYGCREIWFVPFLEGQASQALLSSCQSSHPKHCSVLSTVSFLVFCKLLISFIFIRFKKNCAFLLKVLTTTYTWVPHAQGSYLSPAPPRLALQHPWEELPSSCYQWGIRNLGRVSSFCNSRQYMLAQGFEAG